jgi:hypothetical protein
VFFRAGWNAKQVQLVLGHHSPAFTLSTYVHLIPDDLPDASFLDSEIGAPADQKREEGDERRRLEPPLPSILAEGSEGFASQEPAICGSLSGTWARSGDGAGAS